MPAEWKNTPMLFGTIKGYLNVRAQIGLGEQQEGVVAGLNQGEKQKEKLAWHMWHSVDSNIQMNAIPVGMRHNCPIVLC